MAGNPQGYQIQLHPLPKGAIQNHLGKGKRQPSQEAPWGNGQWGFLRSVAIGESLYAIMSREGWRVSIEHLNTFWWLHIDCVRDARRYRVPCTVCDLNSPAHQELFDNLFAELSSARTEQRKVERGER